ncbi:uncharacterized protein [Clytia hemisphaerica]|uniref:uncharacterized protein n=2 Tax=Clytia hemisphaerica TaxID=252671 RepID=UPI0034D3F900
MDSFCPLISTVLNAVMKVTKEDPKIGPKSTCYGVMCKARYSTSKGVLLAHRNDQLLFASGAKKSSFKWYNKLGLTNSYTTGLKKNKKLSKNHDYDVKKWKEQIENNEDSKPEYQITGDNLDIEQQVRHQGIKNPNKSLHWFNVIASKDRVMKAQDNKTTEDYQNFSILPSVSDSTEVLDDFKFLVSRSIAKFMPSFKMFQKVIPKHMKHDFSEEMSKPSEVVPLGLLFENENESSGMFKILDHLQKEYVPTYVNEENETEVLQQIHFGGDQKTEIRSGSLLRAMSDGDTAFERLDGLLPKFEDWHLKRTFSDVKESIFGHPNSGSQFGTSQWAMNVLRCTNAKKGPHKAFNAYSEYTDKELDAQIVSIAMTYFGMKNIEGEYF